MEEPFNMTDCPLFSSLMGQMNQEYGEKEESPKKRSKSRKRRKSKKRRTSKRKSK